MINNEQVEILQVMYDDLVGEINEIGEELRKKRNELNIISKSYQNKQILRNRIGEVLDIISGVESNN
jgi:hypothetical protein